MMLDLHTALRDAFAEALTRLYGLDPAALPAIVLEVPPSRAMGDLASPLAFELARRLRKAPRAIAIEIVNGLGPVEGVANVQAAPNGYVNVFLDRAAFLRRALAPAADVRSGAATSAGDRGKTIVEHTAINPNKAAHIGHLRNAALGDTLVRMLRYRGVPVEVQNYIDDTGVQVADVVVGFRHLEGKTLDEVRHLAETTRFDYTCWDLYARVTEWYVADKSRLKIRSETLHAIERGGNDDAALGAFIADRIVRCHLKTMGRMSVDYDLLSWEGDILRLQFWAAAAEILRASGAMFLQTEGKLAGCWVMRIEDADQAGEDGSSSTPPDGEEEDPDSAKEATVSAEEDTVPREKVIVRSDGTVTYVGKDIAYQFWKFGLLGKDFHYRRFATKLDGGTLWATSSNAARNEDSAADRPAFGHAEGVYNVIDTRQTNLQKLLKQALATLGHTTEAEHSTHFAYEMVALSHRTARELGYSDVDESRPFVEVSGRKGLGVKADDLLDRLFDKAAAEVQARNPDMPAAQVRETATMIGIAAVRYLLAKFTRTKIIAFDIDEALSFEGESGPYLQYSAVRAQNIFNKLREREGLDEAALIARLPETPAVALHPGGEGDELWNLVLEATRLDEVVQQAVRTLEPAVVARHAFMLAQSFNALYHKYPILNEDRGEHRIWRAAVVSWFRRQITQALDLIGARVPARM